MMNFIVITSIFNPTEAVIKFSKIPNFKLIVVGDKKTPNNWSYRNVKFISIKDQNSINAKFCNLLPFNHYSRKMMGYLYALKNNAVIIYDTDDDNIPRKDWYIPSFNETYRSTKPGLGFFNVLNEFTDIKIWPRGFPLQKILNQNSKPDSFSSKQKKFNIGIWQGLVDEDPDVDAIFRMTIGGEIYFKDAAPLVLDTNTICPLNTQNTAFTQKVFPLLYIPAYVSFRFTDILRGLVAQPILWAAGYRVGFHGPSVVQHRNPHNLLNDFESEIPCYLYPEIIIEVVNKAISPKFSLKENLYSAYEALTKIKIVDKKELTLLRAWIEVFN